METGGSEGAIELSGRSAHTRVTDGEGDTTETTGESNTRVTYGEGNTTETAGERNMTSLHEVSNAKKLKLEGLNTVVEQQGQTINGLLTLAFQLANYYCVSQAVVFSALPGDSPSLKCHDVWFPLVLSLLPGFLNLCALHVIGKKFIKAYTERDRSIRHRNELTLTMRPEASSPTGDEPNREQLIGVDPALKKLLETYFYACIIAFAFLAIVIAFGSAWILCLEKIIVKHHDEDDAAKCLKLCDGGKCIRICPES
ncbi:hypothetical protein RHMOL_Rhmol02G0242800 [Rhododendron molle]|uniref:Uncharacterized protein n=1 Tax=Rhododendron molle TaxID=49168 RepID=A0ACC0PV88_RHOML|nr:hypothetical protein RHMOL_Rhmol02G0242800 [Rhododendron molle]